jgi:hypothetical protein
MTKRSADDLKEKVPPTMRLALREQTEEGLRLAQELLKANKYKEAFRQYKVTLANAEGTNIFPSEAEMVKLARNYRPALVALKQWRNQKEKLILAQTADSTVFRQWERLNKCLNDKDRILVVFRKLRSANADEELLRSFYWQIWTRLAKSKQYEELRPFLDTLGWMTFLAVSEHHAQLWFPQKPSLAPSVGKIMKEGTLIYEVALALHADEAAEAIEEKLLSVDQSDATYAALIEGARRARRTQQAKALFEHARKQLGNRRVRKSTNAMGRLAI